jgi:hypothetical protein
MPVAFKKSSVQTHECISQKEEEKMLSAVFKQVWQIQKVLVLTKNLKISSNTVLRES